MSEDSYLTLKELIDSIKHYNGLLMNYEKRLTKLETLVYVLLAMNGLNILLFIFH